MTLQLSLQRSHLKLFGYLSHECVHAANAIISSRDLIIESEASATKNDEVLAYLVSYLVEQALLKFSKASSKKKVESPSHVEKKAAKSSRKVKKS